MNQEPKKLKIGLFIDTFFPMVDGVVMVVDNFARRMCKVADVTVFTVKSRKKFDDSTLPYKVVRCPIVRTPWLDYDLPVPKLSGKFKKAIKDANLDVVHIHSPFGVGKMGAKYAKKHNIPLVATMHSQYKKDFLKETHNWKWLANHLLKKVMKVFDMCDECWAVNDQVPKIYFEEYGAKKLPGTRNNGTDLTLFDNEEEILALKSKYNVKPDEKVFLFIGRITVLKNIPFILESLSNLKKQNFKFKMIFVGSGPDMEKMQNLAKSLDIEECVVFAGKIMDRVEIAKHYKMADLFLFPSLYDCSSLVQIEASSQKTPTLFLQGATTADTITPEHNGYVSNNSPQDYANKIIEIFGNPTLYASVCENAYKELYKTWDTCAQIALDDYKRHLGIKDSEKENATIH